MIYFDNAATTYPKPEAVYMAMDYANREWAVNAGRGSYKAARKAESIISETRERLLNLVCGNGNYDLIFTPSATIALNQIICGLEWKECDNVYVSPYEHNAVMRTLNYAQKIYGFKIIELPLNTDMSINIEKTGYFFSKSRPDKVFISHVSNVIGYILPVERLTCLSKEYGAVVILDSSQALGLVNIDLRKLDIDYLVFAGHKTLYGPIGVGGFFIKCGNRLDTYITGGTGTDSLNLNMPEYLPTRYEPASANITAIAGLRAALKEIENKDCIKDFLLHEQELCRRLICGLEKNDDVKLYTAPNNSHTGIVAFNIEGYKAAETGMILDEDYDIAVRTGYHCAPLIHNYLEDKDYAGVVRASVGRFSTKEDVETLVRAVGEMAQ